LIHFQGDDGSALIFALMFIIMTFAAGVQIRYYVLSVLAIAMAAPFVWTSVMNDDQRSRILVLLNLDENPKSVYGWQQYQGKLSIAAGGYKGEGLFKGQRVGYGIVPEQENDFIFTVAGEELGFIGCCLILALFLVMLLRIFYKSASARDEFGQNLCIGVFSLILSQVTVNIGMVLGFLPVVGVTLPFFSAGGTSLMMLMLCMGIIQSVHIYSSEERLIIKRNKREL
ncbi:MAG: FtsW/RodA/SpoVE family cell cycle protein, partial [Clostridia bacterium]|nr:FtsW/RodA/SpoVE family cell cycle protein [Clostridia bacterium]